MSIAAKLSLCAALLSGCYDFSRFDHLDGGSFDSGGLDGGVSVDGDAQDLAGATLLIDAPFDTLDTRWRPDDATTAQALSLDMQTKIMGGAALHLDVDKLAASGFQDVGLIHWVGASLADPPGARQLRFYARYDGDLTNNANLAVLATSDGNGAIVTLTPVDGNDPSAGAAVVLNLFSQGPFSVTKATVQEGEWHCYELGLTPNPDGTWSSSLAVDSVGQGQQASTVSEEPVNVSLGFSIAELPPTGTHDAWIDAVQLRAGDAPIGCPY